MAKKFWIATASTVAVGAIVVATPVKAQPVAEKKGDKEGVSSLSARELEQKIGGRTTLELKFEGLTAPEASAVLAQSSGLRFGPPQDSPWGTLVTTSAQGAPSPADVPRYNAEVAKMDFWPALRAWSRAENARLKREREALQRLQSQEKPPPTPTAPQGEEVAPEVMQAWQTEHNEWMRRRSQQMQRFSFKGGVGVHFDSNLQAWSLISDDQIGTGRALNTWPCLVLATGFQRSQNLSIEENEAGQKPQPEAADNAARITTLGQNSAEAVEGGQLSDSMSLSLSVYLEPKLLERAKVQLQVNEARDDAGQDLLPERAKGAGGRAHLQWKDQFIAGLQSPVSLRPRQSEGKKLAVLRGVILIRYPMQLQEHEITDFSGPQGFAIGTGGLPAQAQFQPPRIEDGQLKFGASVVVDSSRGGRALNSDAFNRVNRWRRGDMSEGLLGQFLLPSEYAFTDSQGRTWRSNARTLESLNFSLKGPDGKIVPQTSPPTPPPDNFTYTEERSGTIQLAPPSTPPVVPGAPPRLTITPSILHRTGEATYISQVPVGNSFGNTSGAFTMPPQLTPEELAQLRFTKATFTTESDWRTLEVPFEFRDLPLPPR